MNDRNHADKTGAVIAATRSDAEFVEALTAPIATLFDLNPDILTMSAKVRHAHEVGKRLYVHMDLARGIGKDDSGIRYLTRLGVDGIISTKTSLVKSAREQGLSTVQRFFILDSRSVETALEGLRTSRPDFIEIMPGLLTKTIRRLAALTDIPLIAGGLIETPAEVADAWQSGALAVSTGKRELWSLGR